MPVVCYERFEPSQHWRPALRGDVKHPPPKALLKFLKPYEHAIRELALAVRSVVLAEMAPCHENIYDAYNAVALGYGPTDRVGDGICHVAVYAKHVNLGFNRGSQMDDPEHILQGSGRWIRHITIKSPADLARPEIRKYLRRARELARANIRLHSEVKGVTSTVKAVYPTKRRPDRQGKRRGA
jgi:hypothetical protein